MFRPRFDRTVVAASALLAMSLNAAAGEPSAPPAAPVAPEAPAAPAAPRQRPLSPELAGHVEHSMAQALVRLQGLENLVELRHLEQLAELDADIDASRFDAMIAAVEADAVARSTSRYGSSDANGAVIDQTRSLKSNGRVYVNNVAGIIDVSVWDRNEVRIGGRLGGNLETLDINGDSNEVNVVVKLPRKSRSSNDTVLELKVPNNARVELESVSADVVVNGPRGPVKVNTVSGDVHLVLGSPEVSVQTVSGDLTLKAPASKSTRINSVSGDLDLDGLSGQLALETVSGNVDLARGGRFSDLKLKSISGDIRLDVALDAGAQVSGQTLSGEITMIVPQSLSGTALLKSFSGDVECEGAQTVENHSSRKREYVWGDGRGARLELSSFSGDIRIERK